jgi:hypothetical protein
VISSAYLLRVPHHHGRRHNGTCLLNYELLSLPSICVHVPCLFYSFYHSSTCCLRSCVQKNLYKHSFVARSSCARREIDGCLLLNIVVFHTIICLFSALSWEMQQSFKIIGSSILKKIRCNITRLCCVSFNMNIVEIQLDDLDNRS